MYKYVLHQKVQQCQHKWYDNLKKNERLVINASQMSPVNEIKMISWNQCSNGEKKQCDKAQKMNQLESTQQFINSQTNISFNAKDSIKKSVNNALSVKAHKILRPSSFQTVDRLRWPTAHQKTSYACLFGNVLSFLCNLCSAQMSHYPFL